MSFGFLTSFLCFFFTLWHDAVLSSQPRRRRLINTLHTVEASEVPTIRLGTAVTQRRKTNLQQTSWFEWNRLLTIRGFRLAGNWIIFLFIIEWQARSTAKRLMISAIRECFSIFETASKHTFCSFNKFTSSSSSRGALCGDRSWPILAFPIYSSNRLFSCFIIHTSQYSSSLKCVDIWHANQVKQLKLLSTRTAKKSTFFLCHGHNDFARAVFVPARDFIYRLSVRSNFNFLETISAKSTDWWRQSEKKAPHKISTRPQNNEKSKLRISRVESL